MRYNGFCEYPFARHEANRCDIVSYSDEENGVAEDTPICCGHYWAHLRTYYPGERIEELRDCYSEWIALINPIAK